ncbi:MBL fold metallo-hydrolase [Nonomuraea rhodomycinica]|uniref:MBL fold metallo-hydrolase n=1 Tax=Nonomuraea rhodomycinica TaxID=1712872 RepID=UPI001C37852E|nr:MBL fold metallo-hydrolase [Nonomuraea rhodomycinica]
MAGTMPGSNSVIWLDELPAAVPLAGDNLRLSVNAFFVTDGTRSVLIDTGASDVWHDPTMGLIYDALDEAGVDRADVTDVAITHQHEDHVSGLIAPDGSEAFTELDQPHVSWELDGDQSQARAARAALLERLTRPDHFVAGAHLDSPGIARVTASGDGYALEYLAPPIG